jgi:hypothetical protein
MPVPDDTADALSASVFERANELKAKGVELPHAAAVELLRQMRDGDAGILSRSEVQAATCLRNRKLT